MIFNLKNGSASTDLHGSNGGGGFRTVLKLPFGLVVCYRVRWGCALIAQLHVMVWLYFTLGGFDMWEMERVVVKQYSILLCVEVIISF